MPAEQQEDQAEDAVVRRQLEQGLDLVGRGRRRVGQAGGGPAYPGQQVDQDHAEEMHRRGDREDDRDQQPGRMQVEVAVQRDQHRQMQSRDLDRVDHVIQPLAEQAATAAQSRELAVGGVQRVAEHQERGDEHADRPGGRGEGEDHQPGQRERRADVGHLVGGQADLVRRGREDPAERAVDVERIGRCALRALLRLLQPVQGRSEPLGRFGLGRQRRHDRTLTHSPYMSPNTWPAPIRAFAALYPRSMVRRQWKEPTAAQITAASATLALVERTTWPGSGVDGLLDRALRLMDSKPGRSLLGSGGAPASGKSTLAELLLLELRAATAGRGRRGRHGRLPHRPPGAGAPRPDRGQGGAGDLRRDRIHSSAAADPDRVAARSTRRSSPGRSRTRSPTSPRSTPRSGWWSSKGTTCCWTPRRGTAYDRCSTKPGSCTWTTTSGGAGWCAGTSASATTRKTARARTLGSDERNAQLVNAAPNRPDLWIAHQFWH